MRRLMFLTIVFIAFASSSDAQSSRVLRGTVITPQFELVPNIKIEVRSPGATVSAITDAEGAFSLTVPEGQLIVTFSGQNISPQTRAFAASDDTSDMSVKISYVVPPLTETVTINAAALSPHIQFSNDAIYRSTLFGRDDQLVHTLNAGISAGQHEGGGKSLEIRRYGFNLDHGGVGGGVKINIDNVQQNQATQGHDRGIWDLSNPFRQNWLMTLLSSAGHSPLLTAISPA